MRAYLILAILLVAASCGDKSTEQPGAQNPIQREQPPVSSNPDFSLGDESVSFFETKEFQTSLTQIELKERILYNHGYRIFKKEDGTYSWKIYFHKNEFGEAVKWREGLFVTKYRTKLGGSTHNFVTGEELPVYSEAMSLYHTEPVFEFLSVENWPKLKKYLSETQDAIAAHYNKYVNDLDESSKADLEAKYNLVTLAYDNAKRHVEYLSLPVMTWEEIIKNHGLADTIWISKSLNLIDIADKMMKGENVAEYGAQGLIKRLKHEPQALFEYDKRFKVISTLFFFIQEI